MPDSPEQRIAEFAKAFRVKPGSKVNLQKDFDPAFKTSLSEEDTKKLQEALTPPEGVGTAS